MSTATCSACGPGRLGAPIFVKEVLGLGLESYAIVSIATAIGMITSTVLLRRFGRGLANSRLIVWGIIMDGLTFVPMLWVTSLPGMFVVMMVHAMAIPLIMVCRTHPPPLGARRQARDLAQCA